MASGRHILLIHPPVARACEPPGGIARLAGCLRANRFDCSVWDANLGAQLWLLARNAARGVEDTWTRRAARKFPGLLESLRNPALYESPDRYRRCVTDLNRLIGSADIPHGISNGLADYHDAQLSPLSSADLELSARRHRENPFHAFFEEVLPGIVHEKGPDAFGVSLNYLSQALCAFALIGFVRERWPQVPILLGGGLVTSWLSRRGPENPFPGLVDRCIAGPGEAALIELAGGRPAPFRFSCPDYSDFPARDYLSPGFVLPYSASLGCSWRRCTFCPERSEARPYEAVSGDQAGSEISRLVRATRPALIHFLDNTMSGHLLTDLARTPPGAPWYGFTRITPKLADPGFCTALKQSGCAMLKLGLESGDQRVLDALGKGISVETASRVLKSLKAAGIRTYVYLLFGTPEETYASALQTLDFTIRHHDWIDFLNVAVFNLPLGSDAAGHLPVKPFYGGDLSLYGDFEHPSGWGRKTVRGFLEKEFRKAPSVSAILRRHPLYFTSNHAPFFRSDFC